MLSSKRLDSRGSRYGAGSLQEARLLPHFANCATQLAAQDHDGETAPE